jgi:hypothetical protein
MDEPSVATDAVGAGFDAGFSAVLCAKAGESGPTASMAAMKNAKRDLPAGNPGHLFSENKLDRFVLTSNRKDFAASQRVVMIIFPLEILSQRDAFICF